MTVVNPKSISGITSITTASGSDNLLTIHTSDASNTERFRIDSTGTTKIVTGIVTTLTATTGIVTTFTADTARINTTSLTSTKMAIQSTASSGSGSACGLRIGNNVGALSKYPADLELRTTGVENYNAIRTDAGDGNGGFTAGVQGYNGFLNLTTGGTDVVGVKLSADGNTNFFNGSTGLNASVGIGTTVVGSATNLTLGRRDSTNEGGELGFCRANDGTQYWQMDVYGSNDTPALRFHNSGSTKITFLGAGGICPSGELNAANALDDYEEGDYIPSFTVGSGSVTIDSSRKTLCYTKIGRQVTIIGQLKVASVSGPSGIFRASLPFTRGNQTEEADRTMCNIVVTNAAVNNANEFSNYPDGGSDSYLEIVSISGTSVTRNGGQNMQSNTYIYVNYTYFTAQTIRYVYKLIRYKPVLIGD